MAGCRSLRVHGRPDAGPHLHRRDCGAHDSGVERVRENLEKIGDGGLGAAWTGSAGGKTLMTMPKAALLRALLMNHTYHHRGQLSVYLRLLDVPVPPIYGPSADENPFT